MLIAKDISCKLFTDIIASYSEYFAMFHSSNLTELFTVSEYARSIKPMWGPQLSSIGQLLFTDSFFRVQCLRGRASDSRLRGSGFETCTAMLKPWASFFNLHCSSSLHCIKEYLAIGSGGYLYEQPSPINCSVWLDAS